MDPWLPRGIVEEEVGSTSHRHRCASQSRSGGTSQSGRCCLGGTRRTRRTRRASVAAEADGWGAKGAEVTKLHLSLEMMPQDPQVGYGKSLMTCYDMIGSLGDLGMYCQAFDDIPIYSLLFPVTKGCTYFQLFESFPNFENMPEAGRNLRSVSGTDAGIARVIEFKDCIDLPLA